MWHSINDQIEYNRVVLKLHNEPLTNVSIYEGRNFPT